MIKFTACLLVALAAWGPISAEARALSLKKMHREPAEGRRVFSAAELVALRKKVEANPRDRGARLALVMALSSSGKLKEAVAEAQRWRQRDAYNLVVVRVLGDLYSELGELDRARRVYSAVVELLPRDADAQRALATVLKQSGQLEQAYQRLTAASAIRPEDMRIRFELADVALRLGRRQQARQLLQQIAADEQTSHKIRYPAKQRLAQLLAQQLLKARQRRQRGKTRQLQGALSALAVKGGVRNDIKIYLTWDSNRTDVDLWVTNPAGEVVMYNKKLGRFGGALFDDVTDGYGPESFTAKEAVKGRYLVQVNYFGTNRRVFTEARGEVQVVLNEGTRRERRFALPYRLFKPKQTVAVAQIVVD